MSRPNKSRRQKLRKTAVWNSHHKSPDGRVAALSSSSATPPNKRMAIKRRKQAEDDAPVRLNKLIADSGLCSRREAERWITDGRVTVNFEPITELGVKASPTDVVLVDNRPLPRAHKMTIVFHKPVGVVTTRKDDKGRETIYDVIPKRYHGCDPAGRLDRQSSGLLVMTNDGDLLHEITHPSSGFGKVYRVRVNRPLTEGIAKQLTQGVEITLDDGSTVTAKAHKVVVLSETTLTITLLTGLNRQIRRMLLAIGYDVTMLRRLAFGPIQLGRLPAGKCRQLTKEELLGLRKAIRQAEKAKAKAKATTANK